MDFSKGKRSSLRILIKKLSVREGKPNLEISNKFKYE